MRAARYNIPVLACLTCLLWIAGAQAEPSQLKISATYPNESTGTMHFAESLAISLGSLKPLVLKGEFGVPIPGPHYRLDDEHFLLLGWSSGGSGMQALHGLLIVARDGALTVAQELELMTDRPSAGMVVRSEGTGGIRLGVMEPKEFLHNEEDWFYAAGEQRLDADTIRKLPYEEYERVEGDTVYAPPFGKLPKGRIAWITVTAEGFAFPRDSRAGGSSSPGGKCPSPRGAARSPGGMAQSPAGAAQSPRGMT